MTLLTLKPLTEKYFSLLRPSSKWHPLIRKFERGYIHIIHSTNPALAFTSNNHHHSAYVPNAGGTNLFIPYVASLVYSPMFIIIILLIEREMGEPICYHA